MTTGPLNLQAKAKNGKEGDAPNPTRVGTQPYPSVDNWIKGLLSKALPTRARLSFSHHQSVPSGSLHKPLSLLHQRADRGSKKNSSPTETKTKPYYGKLISMQKQKVTSQMKGKDKTPEKQLNKMEIGKLLEKEFRLMIVNMIQDLGKRMKAKIEKMQKMFARDLQELKNKQTR